MKAQYAHRFKPPSRRTKNFLAENLGKKLWVSATKGIEEKTSFTMSEVVSDALGFGGSVQRNIALAAISGPTFAREVAEKFAKDSSSQLGKIKRARQGQFSIKDRDNNTPYIKNVRVVSTLEYYLSD